MFRMNLYSIRELRIGEIEIAREGHIKMTIKCSRIYVQYRRISSVFECKNSVTSTFSIRYARIRTKTRRYSEICGKIAGEEMLCRVKIAVKRGQRKKILGCQSAEKKASIDVVLETDEKKFCQNGKWLYLCTRFTKEKELPSERQGRGAATEKKRREHWNQLE